MEWAYEKTASLQDGFVDLGWTIRDAVSAQESLEIGIQDEKLGRISPNGKISLAVLYQRVGDSTHAQELVAAAYVADPNIKDGFSRLGWQGYLQGEGTTFFETFIRKDAELDRRSSAGRIYAALCSTAIGAVSHAEASVENGYFGNPDMRNWHCSIGWLCIRRGDLAKGYELMIRDYNAGRMDEEWLPTFAVALSLNGQCDEAESIAGKLVGCRLDLGRLIVGHRAAPDRVFEYPELQQFVAKQRSFCDLDERRAIVQAN
jgi:hypothetical protein